MRGATREGAPSRWRLVSPWPGVWRAPAGRPGCFARWAGPGACLAVGAGLAWLGGCAHRRAAPPPCGLPPGCALPLGGGDRVGGGNKCPFTVWHSPPVCSLNSIPWHSGRAATQPGRMQRMPPRVCKGFLEPRSAVPRAQRFYRGALRNRLESWHTSGGPRLAPAPTLLLHPRAAASGCVRGWLLGNLRVSFCGVARKVAVRCCARGRAVWAPRRCTDADSGAVVRRRRPRSGCRSCACGRALPACTPQLLFVCQDAGCAQHGEAGGAAPGDCRPLPAPARRSPRHLYAGLGTKRTMLTGSQHLLLVRH